MNTHRPIVVARLEEEIRKMDNRQLQEMIGYIDHCRQVSQFQDPKQRAMQEIRHALTVGYAF
jgi:hypothetical protein